MANHGFGHIGHHLDVEQINNDLLEINKNRFNNLFIIIHEGDDREECWLIELPNSQISFQIWFNKKNKNKKLEYTHNVWGRSGWWFQQTFISLLVSKYDGLISDEGCEGKWIPNFHIRYPYMIDWFMWGLDMARGRIKRAFLTRLYNGQYKEELKQLPKEIISVI